jgi:type VI secretion system secreted protein Hcp
MALNAYIEQMKGQTLGVIKGGVQQKDRVNFMKMHHFSHLISCPRDAQSGRATGMREHHPCEAWIEYDEGFPYIMKALTGNELLTDVKFKFFSATKLGTKTSFGQGTEYHTLSIHLENAFLSSVEIVQPYNLDRELMNIENFCKLKFTYQKIIWMWTGGATYDDNWEERV